MLHEFLARGSVPVVCYKRVKSMYPESHSVFLSFQLPSPIFLSSSPFLSVYLFICLSLYFFIYLSLSLFISLPLSFSLFAFSSIPLFVSIVSHTLRSIQDGLSCSFLCRNSSIHEVERNFAVFDVILLL